MNNTLTLNSRIIKEGKEADFVDSFLKTNDLFQDSNLDYMILKEIITDGGIPDVLVVSWCKDVKIDWSEERSKLSKNDIKILHFINSKKSKGITKKSIHRTLGFTVNQIEKSTKRLINAELITLSENKVTSTRNNSNFFINEIIAIEAKLKDWKIAIQQANLNSNFSSKSYVLIPENVDQKICTFNNQKLTGLITYNGEKAKIVKKAKKIKQPASYYSWIINEHIGQLINGRKQKGNNH